MSHVSKPRPDHESVEKIRKAVARQDFALSLARVGWDFFCTLTFSGNLPKYKVSYGMAFAWVQDSAKLFGVGRHSLLTALRGEHGELNGRFHFHCLMGGTATRNKVSDGHRLEHLWKQVSGGGRVEVRPYDRSLAGPEYLAKCLGANAYEAGKYSLAESVTLSHSLLRHLAQRDVCTLRRCSEHNRKNGVVTNGGGLSMQALPPSGNLCDETSPLQVGKNSPGHA